MVHAMESLAKDTALRCEEGGEGAAEARELRRRVLSELGRAARHQATGDEAAEGLFRALCGAACHVDDAALPTLLYTDCHLQELLSARPPLRAVWVDWLVSRFSEGARETLVLRLLADFPDSAAAAAAPPERSALGALLRLPPWAGRTPRSAL
ncbi:unnamed protein product [Prorocentrum cordatum]|uniref:HEAT repeat-containing protein 1 n=1 Tax=Prorocentrum cordatum TaxID=2364126 RepID=A0ABN9Q6Y7_9DINO|nr:unnamed protein product [Polarella glacialis]